jgi:hypothetical protein
MKVQFSNSLQHALDEKRKSTHGSKGLFPEQKENEVKILECKLATSGIKH